MKGPSGFEAVPGECQRSQFWSMWVPAAWDRELCHTEWHTQKEWIRWDSTQVPTLLPCCPSLPPPPTGGRDVHLSSMSVSFIQQICCCLLGAQQGKQLSFPWTLHMLTCPVYVLSCQLDCRFFGGKNLLSLLSNSQSKHLLNVMLSIHVVSSILLSQGPHILIPQKTINWLKN